MTALRIESLSKSFGTRRVLHDVDLSVESGQLVAILGPSGSGKTTLLRLLCGFEHAEGGTITIGERVVSAPGVHVPAERRHIGYVPQEGALFPHLSVADNIVFGLPRALRRTRHRVAELLELSGLPVSYAARAPHQLSGGEQQRVALARALAPSPALVLLDEPFSALDAALRAQTRQAVADTLTAAGATAILVTHDQSEALSMGDSVAVLWEGRLAQVATPQQVYRLPVRPELAQFVGEAVLLPGMAGARDVECALGRLPLVPGMPVGPVDVLIRPEQIRIIPAAALQAGSPVVRIARIGAMVAGRVERVAFYGHDASVIVSVTGANPPLRVSARVPGHETPHVGESVAIGIDGEVVAYASVPDIGIGRSGARHALPDIPVPFGYR